MRAPAARRWLAAAVAVCAACATERPPRAIEDELALAARALRDGRIEEAVERVAAVRKRDPRHVEAALWQTAVAMATWRDNEAIAAQQAAIHAAQDQDVAPEALAELEGRLGELLFQVGRWGDSVPELQAGAVGVSCDRRAAMAVVAEQLPFTRAVAGPVASEQPLLAGGMPEFLCGVGDKQRSFAIDTGTSMTTISSSFADELAVRQRRPAGTVFDGAGRPLAVDIGVLDRFAAGAIDLGAVPVLIADDAALRLRDIQGGDDRVRHGILGLDLLSTFRLTLDPERASVVLELPRGLPEGQSVACVRAEGACLVPVAVDDVSLWFVLDTGASDSSLTEAGLDRLHGGASRASPAYRLVRTVCGEPIVSVRDVRDLSLRCSEVRFSGVRLPVVARRPSAQFPVHGVLGVDLLGRCRLTFDGGRARLVQP
jgi:hypothetical protein